MFTSLSEKFPVSHIVVLVEVDMQKLRVRIVWAREAIGERMRELEHPKHSRGEFQDVPDI